MRGLLALLDVTVLLGPVEETTCAPQIEVGPDEGEHRDAKPNGRFQTLMIHKKSPGMAWLVRPLMRPPKKMILGSAVANITKINEFVMVTGTVNRASFVGFEGRP